ncbi:MAG TPA: hypothetical protein VFL76_09600 [Edaphocola sp.]|nr:hypothetical protein [Edaphocola sp.]
MKNFFLLLPFCLLGLVGPAAAQVTRPLSKLVFHDVDHNRFTAKDLPANTALLLLYFRTDCDDCRHTAQIVGQTAGQYPLTIWMVSPNDEETLGVFEYMTGLDKARNVRVLRDDQDIMHQLFDFQALPFCVLFDKSGREIKTYDYFPKPETIKKDLGE